MNTFRVLEECIGFEWDRHNVEKNWRRHGVSPVECEQVFFNPPLVVVEDAGHSQAEMRFCALGKTDRGRKLFIAFTIRKGLVRVISARDMSRRERCAYEKHEKEKNA